MGSGPREPNKILWRTNVWSKKRHFSYGFDAVLKLKTDEKWSLGAKKRRSFCVEKLYLLFGFDAVLELKSDEKWSLGAPKKYMRGQILVEK